MMEVEARQGSTVVLRGSDGSETSVPLYSAEGIDLLAALRLKQMAEYRTMYEPTWLGVPIIQLPNDIVAMQELIWRLQPDAVVEVGVAHGGSLVMYASLCALMGRGRVLGIDVEIRKANRERLLAHPLARYIELFECSSVDDRAVTRAADFCQGAGTVLIVLDSNHAAEHVCRELQLYARLVTPGSYLVVMDGGQAFVSDIPRGKAEWRHDNPLTAIRRFLAETDAFEVDPHFTRFGATSCPEGFLRRRAGNPG